MSMRFDTPPHVARNTLDGLILSSMTTGQRRSRRRRGQDTARGQRRALLAWRREIKTPEGKAKLAQAAGEASLALREMEAKSVAAIQQATGGSR